jgi:anthraniloyl-CoA monooxygenase
MRDPKSYELIRSRFAYWDDLDVARDGEVVRITGNGFCGCSRKTLLQLLQQRCTEEGVQLHFEHPVEDVSQFKDSDYIIACDGINSGIREQFQKAFGPKIELRKNKFVWLGSTKPLDAFTYFFKTTVYGTFVAHTYQYEEGMSTWIFECTENTWQNAEFETADESDTIQKLSAIFAEELDGHELISNKSHWPQFRQLSTTNGAKTISYCLVMPKPRPTTLSVRVPNSLWNAPLHWPTPLSNSGPTVKKHSHNMKHCAVTV